MSTTLGYSADDVTSEDTQGENDAILFDEQGTTVIRVKRSHPYTFVVYTSKKHTGTTDGDVIVIVYGSKNRRGVGFVLKKESAQGVAFLEGQKDYFSVQSKHLGTINKVKIKPASKATFKDWFLRKIIISDESTNTEYCFICRKKIFTGTSTSYKMTVDGCVQTASDGEYSPVKTKKLHFKPKAKVITLPPDPNQFTNGSTNGHHLVTEIDSMMEKNVVQHHTSKYRLDGKPRCLLLRRGETFLITIRLTSDSNFPQGSMYFIAVTGSRPRLKENTLVNIFKCSLEEFDELRLTGRWGYCVRHSNLKEILVEIYIPATVIAGKYKMILKDDHKTLDFAGPVYILFNPWAPEDEVYMEDEEMRGEYVTKQSGLIYVGGANKPRCRNWYFGQFEEVSLDAALMLLEEAKPSKRDSVAEISRKLTAMINENENTYGLISGNWTSNYEGGRPPSYWNSTPAILEIFLTSSQAVKWGQCWVYSAVVTTIFRTLGIPCRPVTNFYSAHDPNGYCTYDIYLDKKGEKIKSMTNDNIWMFHVWNDVWMERKDLPSEYSGWQALDACPQERSEGFVQMGPAPLRAIKEGDIDLPYDTAYILAQVNADKLYKQQNTNGEWEVIGFDQKSVGTKISTKAVGNDTRHDITHEYKYKDNSVLERESVKNTLVKVQNHEFRDCDEDIRVELIADDTCVDVGDDVILNVQIHNTSCDDQTVQLILCGYIVRYDGETKAQLQKYSETFETTAGNSTETTFTVTSSQYLLYLEDETMIKFVATASVDGTGQVSCSEEVIDLAKPSLKITGLPEQLLAGVTQEFVISFTNPLEIELTDCEIYIDGSIIPTRIYIKGIRDIPPDGKLIEPVRLTPFIPSGPHNRAVRSTKKSMTVSFTCKELGGLNETLKVFVINIK